jgi:hypothetical protein
MLDFVDVEFESGGDAVNDTTDGGAVALAKGCQSEDVSKAIHHGLV